MSFTIVHRSRQSWSRVQKSRGAKVIREERWKTKNLSGGRCRVRGWVLVVPFGVSNDNHIVTLIILRTRSSPRTSVELRRGSEVGLLNGLADSRGRLINTEGELHSFDSAWEGMLASLAVALLFDCTFADHVSGVIALEVGSLKLLNAPAKKSGLKKERKMTERHTPAFLLVQLVTHRFREFLEFTFRFSVVGVNHEILKVP